MKLGREHFMIGFGLWLGYKAITRWNDWDVMELDIKRYFKKKNTFGATGLTPEEILKRSEEMMREL